MMMTREYELIKELVERGTCLEHINKMYEVAKQEKEKKEKEVKLQNAREEVAEATAEYVKLLTGIEVDVAEFIKSMIDEEVKIKKVDFAKTKAEASYKTDAVSEWLKENGLF